MGKVNSLGRREYSIPVSIDEYGWCMVAPSNATNNTADIIVSETGYIAVMCSDGHGEIKLVRPG